ncbi:L-aspartate oxidase [Burkholderia pseudomallei MSHR7343]|nr:L-aspartate oxidase [Burkholderia pseudomallei MSHR7343]
MGVFSITPLKNKNPHLARVCQQSEPRKRGAFCVGARASASATRYALPFPPHCAWRER